MLGFAARKRCVHGTCGSDCIGASTAAVLVIAAATIACVASFLSSAGVPFTATISTGFHLTYVSLMIIVTWLVSIVLNITRKHESVIWCFIDSIGIPAILLSLPEIAVFFTKAAIEKLGG